MWTENGESNRRPVWSTIILRVYFIDRSFNWTPQFQANVITIYNCIDIYDFSVSTKFLYIFIYDRELIVKVNLPAVDIGIDIFNYFKFTRIEQHEFEKANKFVFNTLFERFCISAFADP